MHEGGGGGSRDGLQAGWWAGGGGEEEKEQCDVKMMSLAEYFTLTVHVVYLS